MVAYVITFDGYARHLPPTPQLATSTNVVSFSHGLERLTTHGYALNAHIVSITYACYILCSPLQRLQEVEIRSILMSPSDVT